jgi:hypothetical protein
MEPEQFEAIWGVLKWFVNAPVGIGLVVVAMWFFGNKAWTRYKNLEATVQSLQDMIMGIAFYQKDAETDIITYATGPLAALLGNKMSVKEIVGKPVNRVFDHNTAGVLKDMDARLCRNDEVVENSVPINGTLCTVAKRKVFIGPRTFFQAYIHRQDVKL